MRLSGSAGGKFNIGGESSAPCVACEASRVSSGVTAFRDWDDGREDAWCNWSGQIVLSRVGLKHIYVASPGKCKIRDISPRGRNELTDGQGFASMIQIATARERSQNRADAIHGAIVP